MIETTRGARISGTILHVFGGITLFVAFLLYVFFIGITLEIFSDLKVIESENILGLIGLWLGSILVQSIGHIMKRAGDYMQGSFGEISQNIFLQGSLFHLLKDNCIVQVFLCSVMAILFLSSVDIMMTAICLTVMVAFVVAISICNQRLRTLNVLLKEKHELIIF